MGAGSPVGGRLGGQAGEVEGEIERPPDSQIGNGPHPATIDQLFECVFGGGGGGGRLSSPLYDILRTSTTPLPLSRPWARPCPAGGGSRAIAHIGQQASTMSGTHWRDSTGSTPEGRTNRQGHHKRALPYDTTVRLANKGVKNWLKTLENNWNKLCALCLLQSALFTQAKSIKSRAVTN